MPLLRFTIPFCRRIFVGVGHPSDRFYRPCTLTSTFQKYLSNSVYFSTDAVENNGCEHDENNPRWSGADFRLASDIEENIQTPALVVSLPNVRHNISAMIQLCGGDVDRWRPHVKTTKMPLIWSELLSMGVRNFKCATIREARLLAATAKNMGLSTDCDILVAFPLHGANLRALEILAGEERECTFSCLVEAPEDIAQIPATVGFYIDINPGMDRTGRSLDVLTDQMAAMVECLKILNLHSDEGGHGNRFRGLHFYDGHSSTTPCGKARREMLFPIYNELLTFTQKLEQAYGRPVDEIITSGTPSCTSALSFEKFRGRSFHHRVSPGTTVLHDGKTREENEDLDAVLRPAAAVMARVISHPNSGIFTVDAGSKALAAEVPAPIARILDLENVIALGPSEEHLPFEVQVTEYDQPVALPPRGSIVYLVPKHICPTVNLFEKAVVVDGDHTNVTETVVSARAHDLWIEGPVK